MTYEGKGEMTLVNSEGTGTLDANMDFKMDGYESVVKAAQSKGVPVATRALGLLEISLKDKTNVVGQAYFSSDGDLVTYYKKLVGLALDETDAGAEVEKAVKDFAFKEGAFSLNLEGQDLALKGYSETSDLSYTAKLIQAKFAPQIEGEVAGVNAVMNFEPNGAGSKTLNVHFTNLFPGKSGEETKKLLGLNSSAKVTEGAPAGETKLVAVEKPSIEMPSRLAGVQADALKRLGASSPLAGGGGSKSWIWILAGVLVLGLVGVGLAAGRKSA